MFEITIFQFSVEVVGKSVRVQQKNAWKSYGVVTDFYARSQHIHIVCKDREVNKVKMQ
jgi:hypothetical protein